MALYDVLNTSNVFMGAGVPPSLLGNSGDWYLRTDTAISYAKIAGIWVVSGGGVIPTQPTVVIGEVLGGPFTTNNSGDTYTFANTPIVSTDAIFVGQQGILASRVGGTVAAGDGYVIIGSSAIFGINVIPNVNEPVRSIYAHN